MFFLNHFCIKIMLNICFTLNLFVYLFSKLIALYNSLGDLLLSHTKNASKNVSNSQPSIFMWYLSLIFQLRFYNYATWLFVVGYCKAQLLIKLIFFKANVNIGAYFNLNNFFFYKFYIKSLLGYYVDILFKVKNKMVYYKSNYFYFRRPKTLRKLRKYKTRLSRTFLNVRTRRNYNSFYNLTINSFFLKNLYSLNLNTYIYI
jgi:hypothetical protein